MVGNGSKKVYYYSYILVSILLVFLLLCNKHYKESLNSIHLLLMFGFKFLFGIIWFTKQWQMEEGRDQMMIGCWFNAICLALDELYIL